MPVYPTGIFFTIGSVKLDVFGVSLDQTVITKFGTFMTRFVDEKHFSSWLSLALKLEISDGKVLNEQNFEYLKSGRADFLHGGVISKAGGHYLWFALSVFETPAGRGTCYCAGGVSDAEVQSGI